jgi:hypothetical protein
MKHVFGILLVLVLGSLGCSDDAAPDIEDDMRETQFVLKNTLGVELSVVVVPTDEDWAYPGQFDVPAEPANYERTIGSVPGLTRSPATVFSSIRVTSSDGVVVYLNATPPTDDDWQLLIDSTELLVYELVLPQDDEAGDKPIGE